MKNIHVTYPPTMEALAYDANPVFGIADVGMGQSGKSTLCHGIADAWNVLDPGASIHHFSNSDGFRGLTADMLVAAGIPNDLTVNDDEIRRAIEDFIDKHGICDERLNGYYHEPKTNAELRTTAVNSAVAYVAEHPVVRPAINKAGSRFMKLIVADPSVVRLDSKVKLFLLDARNIDECNEKFDSAGVRTLASFILLCDEEVVVNRIHDASGLSKQAKIDMLKARNSNDRDRILAKMSLPEDYPESVDISDAVQRIDRRELYAFGRQVAIDPRKRPIVLNTEFTTQEQTEASMQFVLSGLIAY